jgi:hypothetical protein
MKIKDALWIGLFVGLLGPGLGILVFYMISFSGESIAGFINLAVTQKILSPLLSLCAIINLAAFYLFLQYDHYLTARGIILATLLYGVAIVVLKFIL